MCVNCLHFYRAMHLSAKRGIAIACRSSVRLPVTLVDQDHIGWKSWKPIARTISLTHSPMALPAGIRQPGNDTGEFRRQLKAFLFK